MPPNAREMDEITRLVPYLPCNFDRNHATDSPSTSTTASTLCGADDHRIVEACVVADDQGDSTQSGYIPGDKIMDSSAENSVGDEHELHVTIPPWNIPPRFPSPGISFEPLAPPPWHAKLRRPDAIIGPDDPRSYSVDLCRVHDCSPCSRCTKTHCNEPLLFPF